MEGSSLYDFKPDGYYNGARVDLLELVEPGVERVLDIGCGEGNNTSYLRHLGASDIWGVEMSSEAAKQAKTKMDFVFKGTIEAFLESSQAQAQFDLIILGDVLEHLVDPWSVVDKLTELLSENGQILISLPNIRHIAVILPLFLKGEWRYESSGILDDTHLRFFTYSSAVKMFNDAGLKVVKVSSNQIGGKSGVFNRITIGLFRQFFIVQHYFLCQKGNP